MTDSHGQCGVWNSTLSAVVDCFQSYQCSAKASEKPHPSCWKNGSDESLADRLINPVEYEEDLTNPVAVQVKH